MYKDDKDTGTDVGTLILEDNHLEIEAYTVQKEMSITIKVFGRDQDGKLIQACNRQI